MPTWFSEIITPQSAAGRLHAEAEERDRREVDHRVAEQDRRLRDDQRHDVRHDVPQADRGRRGALHLQRRDVRLAAFLQRGAAQHPGDVGHVGDRQRDRRRGRSPAPNTAAARTASRMPGNANRMSSPEEITASTAPRRQAAITASRVPAIKRADHHGQRPEHRGLRAGQQPGQHVSALVVEPEQVAAGRADEGERQVRQRRAVRREQRADHARRTVASAITTADAMPGRAGAAQQADRAAARSRRHLRSVSRWRHGTHCALGSPACTRGSSTA